LFRLIPPASSLTLMHFTKSDLVHPNVHPGRHLLLEGGRYGQPTSTFFSKPSLSIRIDQHSPHFMKRKNTLLRKFLHLYLIIG